MSRFRFRRDRRRSIPIFQAIHRQPSQEKKKLRRHAYVSTRAREKLAKIFSDISFESSADSIYKRWLKQCRQLRLHRQIYHSGQGLRQSQRWCHQTQHRSEYKISSDLCHWGSSERKHLRLSMIWEIHTSIPLICDEAWATNMSGQSREIEFNFRKQCGIEPRELWMVQNQWLPRPHQKNYKHINIGSHELPENWKKRQPS